MVAHSLPQEVLEGQLDTYELLNAMYPATDDDDTGSNNQSVAIVSSLRQWLENQTSPVPETTIPETLSLLVSLEENDNNTRSILVDVTIPLGQLAQNDTLDEDIPLYKLRVLQPDWLTKAEVAQLTQDMPGDDVVSALEHITERARDAALNRALQSASITTTTIKTSMPTPTTPPGMLVRVWFYFPSISTREKRDDIVNYAPSYGLTGFLLAGKPGILCLEGGTREIDAYMKFIKTESWGDIPPQHKKVSERLREEGEDVVRVFAGMEEITDSIEKRGVRGNRGNMQAVEMWLGERGLGDALAKVLM